MEKSKEPGSVEVIDFALKELEVVAQESPEDIKSIVDDLNGKLGEALDGIRTSSLYAVDTLVAVKTQLCNVSNLLKENEKKIFDNAISHLEKGIAMLTAEKLYQNLPGFLKSTETFNKIEKGLNSSNSINDSSLLVELLRKQEENQNHRH